MIVLIKYKLFVIGRNITADTQVRDRSDSHVYIMNACGYENSARNYC